MIAAPTGRGWFRRRRPPEPAARPIRVRIDVLTELGNVGRTFYRHFDGRHWSTSDIEREIWRCYGPDHVRITFCTDHAA